MTADTEKVANLPLLFSNGLPTSLEFMNLEELQNFFRFMMKCEMNSDQLPNLDELTMPVWWPKDLSFSESILKKQKKNRGRLSFSLKKAIRACYSHNDCEFLFDFCRKLLEYVKPSNMEVVENRDGTRSLITRRDRKLLVTFKSENQDYDRNMGDNSNTFSAKSPLKTDVRRLLMKRSDNTSDPSMSTTSDIYLCNTCDEDFDSYKQVVEHEKLCKFVAQEWLNTKSPLCAYLRLQEKGESESPRKKPRRQIEGPITASYETYMNIDISSPLGTNIINSSRLRLDQKDPTARGFCSAQEYLDRLESKCPGTIVALRKSNAYLDKRTKYPIVGKPNRKKPDEWVHLYCFTSKQRAQRLLDIRNGLTAKSFKLWKLCNRRKVNVNCERLDPVLVQQKLDQLGDIQHLSSAVAGTIVANNAAARLSKILVEIQPNNLNFDDEGERRSVKSGSTSPFSSPSSSPPPGNSRQMAGLDEERSQLTGSNNSTTPHHNNHLPHQSCNNTAQQQRTRTGPDGPAASSNHNYFSTTRNAFQNADNLIHEAIILSDSANSDDSDVEIVDDNFNDSKCFSMHNGHTAASRKNQLAGDSKVPLDQLHSYQQPVYQQLFVHPVDEIEDEPSLKRSPNCTPSNSLLNGLNNTASIQYVDLISSDED